MNSICCQNKYGKFNVLENDQWIGQTLMKGLVWNEDVIEFLCKTLPKNKNIIDVGAHIGTHSIPYANHIDTEFKVYSFEPQKRIFELLVKNIEENSILNIIPYNNAVGHLNNIQVSLTNKVTDGFSRNNDLVYNTDKLINYGGICLGKDGQQINMITLDSLKLDNISFIKVDVEGCEKLVLYGAKNLIKKNRPYILFENKKNLTKDMAKIMDIPFDVWNFDIFDYVKKLNYSGIKPINRDFLLIP